MNKNGIQDGRNVIPRWRSLDRTPQHELASSKKGLDRQELDVSAAYDSKLDSWRLNGTLHDATEVMYAIATLGDRPEARGALEQVAAPESDAVEPLRLTAKRLLARGDGGLLDQLPSSETLDHKTIVSKAKLLKQRLRLYPRDGLTALELGRLQFNLGQKNSAKKHVEWASKLYPNSRYITRSATRFFIEVDKPDQAMAIIRRSELLSGDPWVQAAEISTAAILGKTPANVHKHIRRLKGIKRLNINFAELAAGLGVLEFNAGSLRKSKHLFEKAMTAPNDNALAQVCWVQNQGVSIFNGIMPVTGSIPLSYEADLYGALNDDRLGDIQSLSTSWIYDEPFSDRAASAGSSIALSYLYDPDLALWFANQGLAFNPKCHIFKNNKIVALARRGDAHKARQLLDHEKNWQSNDEHAPFYHAARGLIAFREFNVVAGRECYGHAVTAAKVSKNSELVLTAIAYWIEEESVAGSLPASLIFKVIDAIDNFATRVSKKNSHQAHEWKNIKKRIEQRLSSRGPQLDLEFAGDHPIFQLTS